MRLSFVGYALGIPAEFLSRSRSNDFPLEIPVEFLRSSCGVPSEGESNVIEF